MSCGGLAGLAAGPLPLADARLDGIEEALIGADLGPAVAARIRDRLADAKFAKGVDEAGLKAAVAASKAAAAKPVARKKA